MNTLVLAGALGMPKEGLDALRAWAEAGLDPAPLAAPSGEDPVARFLQLDRYFYRRLAAPDPSTWQPPSLDDLPPSLRNGHA